MKATITLDYASPMPPTVPPWRRLIGVLRDAGPWLVWPTWRPLVVVAVMVAAAWWQHRLPRTYERVAWYPIGDDCLLRGDLLFYEHADDGRPHLANLVTGEDRRLTGSTEGDLEWVDATPDCSRLLGGARKTVFVWDAASGALLAAIPSSAFNLHAPGFMDTSFSAPSRDARELIVVEGQGTIARWDISDGETARLVVRRDAGRAFAHCDPLMSADGRRVILRGYDDDVIGVVEATTLEDVTFSPAELKDAQAQARRASSSPRDQFEGLTRLPAQSRFIYNKDDAPYTRVKEFGTIRRLATMRNLHMTRALSDPRRIVAYRWNEIEVWAQVSDEPEPLITRSPRLWIMAPLAAVLAWTLWRDARRRPLAKALAPRHAVVAFGLVAVGAFGFAYGLAETAVKKRYWDDVTWAGGWSIWLMTYGVIGMGCALGGAGWRWIAAGRMLLGAVIAARLIEEIQGEVFALFDEVWRPWYVEPPLLAFACIVLVLGALALVTRPPASSPDTAASPAQRVAHRRTASLSSR